MKKINLFKWMVVLMMLPMGARAQVKSVYPTVQPMKSGLMESTILDQQNYRKVERENKTILSYNKPVQRKESTSDGALVHFVLEYDKDNVYEIKLFMFHDQQYYGTYYGEEGDDFTMSLPKGEWDFCLCIDNTKTLRLEFVIQDLVQIDDDMELTFSEEQATNHIAIKELMPDGKEMTFTTYRQNEQSDIEVVSRGDADELFYSSYTIYKPTGIFYTNWGFAYNFEGSAMIKDFGWWVSPSKSDRFVFCRNEVATEGSQYEYGIRSGNRMYVNQFVTDKTETVTLSNNPSDYIYSENQFIQSKAGKAYESPIYPVAFFGIDLNLIFNDIHVAAIAERPAYLMDENGILKIYNGAVRATVSDLSLELRAVPSFTDNWQPNPWGGKEPRCIYGLATSRIDGKTTYLNVGIANGSYTFNLDTNQGLKHIANPAFSYSPEQKVLAYGSNCPILTFGKYEYDAEWGHFLIAVPFYTGRYGEYRETDIVALEETIKVDGEQVAGSYDEYQQLQGQWIGEGIPTGVFDISLINKNVEVDGLDGKNEATIHFDMGADDREAPTLQMLWFKDKDDKIIDRFAKAEDGTLEFAGGDFNFHFVNEGSYWFDIAEQTVSVSYSPYCKNEWAALEVEEIPENYFAPAFGYFYRGSLKDVEGQGEKGWFDLKIRLEDEAGNWQEQVISPAFRIDDLVDTGISQLTIDNGQLTISGNETVYDVMGRRVADKSSKAMKGIQIVRRQNGDVRKVVVR